MRRSLTLIWGVVKLLQERNRKNGGKRLLQGICGEEAPNREVSNDAKTLRIFGGPNSMEARVAPSP
jgi:hypothetical protein